MDDGFAGTRTQFVAAVRDRDAAAVSALYAEDATLLAPSAELVRGRAAIEEFWRAGLEAGVCDAELEALDVAYEGRFAYEIGRYVLTLDPRDAGGVVDRGKYLLVHTQQGDGSWRRAVEMFNPDAPLANAGE